MCLAFFIKDLLDEPMPDLPEEGKLQKGGRTVSGESLVHSGLFQVHVYKLMYVLKVEASVVNSPASP